MTSIILSALLLALATFLSVLIAQALRAFEKHTRITASKQQLELLNAAILEGIAYAQEQVRKRTGLKLTPLTSEEKRTIAVTYVEDILRLQNVTGPTSMQLEKQVEAQLNLVRDPGAKL